MDIHSDELISRFMKGIFNERPALPRYNSIWDVQIVLKYLENIDTSSLLLLSGKLCMLFLLTTAQRCQTLHALKISDINIYTDKLVINISSVLKQTRPGVHLDPIILKAYSVNKKLCIIETVKEYIDRTQPLRNGNDHLLISTVKPHNSVCKHTVAHWVKLIMSKAGISETFKPHSTRSASSSYAYKKGAPLSDIVKKAGWSNANTFGKYYNKQITTDINTFQTKILMST